MRSSSASDATLGILGGGQLARMIALAARPLGIDCVVVEPTGPDCPAAPVADVLVGSFSDSAVLQELARRCDVITIELEAIPTAAVDELSRLVPVRPGVEALRASQDRLLEKQLVRSLGIPTAPFDDEVAASGPAIVKTRRGGYDGRGQIRTSTPAERASALAELPDPIVEGLVPFRRELSIVAARSLQGQVSCYPLVENLHIDSILRQTTAPADVSPGQQVAGEQIAERLLTSLGFVGVVGIELFDVDDELVVNEFAPRVHNTGHWTIEGAVTNQFEQHVRAVMGMPLGDPSPRGVSVMVNAIGGLCDPAAVLAIPGCHMHAYGKTPRAGRKVGHYTLTADDPDILAGRLARLRALLGQGQSSLRP